MANPWQNFKKLIEGPAMEVATITAINTNGTSTATTANGGEIVVIGTTVTVGNQAFIQGGRLIGEAPSLTYYEIEV